MRRFAALLVGLIVPVSLSAPAASAETPAAISWTPCTEDPTAECGTLAVPVDWNNPAGGTFDVAVARRKATDPARRIGSLVLGPGGPGSSGVNNVLRNAARFSPELRSRFDLVSFDPRGTNRSHPVVCSTELMAQAPDPIMKSQADFDRQLAFNERLRADCKARTGPLFDHVDTLSTTADLDAIRAAIGDDKLTFWGGSYGTLLGQQYAERYPQRVRAVTLDSTMDHSLNTRGFMDTETWAAQDSFNEFVAWCDKSARCAQNGQDVRAYWGRLLARADRGELHLPDQPDVPVTASMLIGAAVGAFYDSAGWPWFSRQLAALDTGGALPPGVTAKSLDRTEEVTPNPLQVFCLDYRLPIRDYREYARHLRRSAAIAPDMRYSTLGLYTVTSCLGQPDPIPNPQHRLSVRTGTPVLVANSLHDPATTYPWALSTAGQLGRSGRLLTYEGWGHIVYGRGDCATGAIDRYLISQTLPERGARCPAVPPAEVTTLRVPTDLLPQPGLPGWRLQIGA